MPSQRPGNMPDGGIRGLPIKQMEQEKAISLERGDKFRAEVIQELILEDRASIIVLK